MGDRDARRVIGLDQREGRARHVDPASPASARMKARASVVLPVPRSPLRQDGGARPWRRATIRRQSRSRRRRHRRDCGHRGVGHAAGRCLRGRRALCRCCGPGDREAADHRRALVDARQERHLALVQFDEALDDGKAEAGPAMAAGHRLRLEAVEDALLEFGLDAAPGVGDPEQDVVAVAPRPHAHGAALRREADGIGEQIVEDLPDALAHRR